MNNSDEPRQALAFGDPWLRRLFGILNELSRQLDFSLFFERAASAAAELLEADGAAFIVLDGPEHLQYRFFIGLPPDYEARYRNHRFPAHQGTAGLALRRGRPVFNQDYAASPQAMPEYVAAGLKSNLALPVYAGEVPVGVLAVSWFSRPAPAPPTDQDLAVVGLLANLIGSAFHRLRLEQELRTQALYDSLTGLPNRSLLFARFEHALYQTRAGGRLLAVMVLDLNGFKQVNDRMGHLVGDRLLRDVAGRLRDVVRRSDLVARLGGDEFVLLVGDCASVGEIEAVAERVYTALNMSVSDGGGMVQQISASIGITIYPFDDASPEALVSHADTAMYEVKRRGNAHYAYFEARMQQRMERKRGLEAALHRALEEGELRLVYQPVLDGRTGEVLGVEALLRWQHPRRGLLTAGEFLPQAEHSPLRTRLEDWVLQNAVQQLAVWRRAGHSLWVSVNLSGRQLASAGFSDRLRELLDEYPECRPGGLKLEILETTAVDDFDLVDRLLEELHGLGVAVLLDDYGTGYASITYLRRLKARGIKIDRDFVAAVHQPGERAVVESLVGLSRAMDLECVAEGVETAEQQAALLGLGCRLLQGHYIARPMPAEALSGWLQQAR